MVKPNGVIVLITMILILLSGFYVQEYFLDSGNTRIPSTPLLIGFRSLAEARLGQPNASLPPLTSPIPLMDNFSYTFLFNSTIYNDSEVRMTNGGDYAVTIVYLTENGRVIVPPGNLTDPYTVNNGRGPVEVAFTPRGHYTLFRVSLPSGQIVNFTCDPAQVCLHRISGVTYNLSNGEKVLFISFGDNRGVSELNTLIVYLVPEVNKG